MHDVRCWQNGWGKVWVLNANWWWVVHQENHFYPGTNMFVSFFPGFHKASQDVLGQPELS
jgi:hypothetical protein